MGQHNHGPAERLECTPYEPGFAAYSREVGLLERTVRTILVMVPARGIDLPLGVTQPFRQDSGL